MDKRDQAELYRKVGIGVHPVGADVDALAVVVVDFQRLFTSGSLASSRTQDVLEQTTVLLHDARRAQTPVIYLRVVYDDPAEVGLVWRAKSPAMLKCLRESDEAEIDPRVAPDPSDIVIEKKRASGFYETVLDRELHRLGVSTLLLVGTSSSGCVRATAVDGAARDYRVLVIADCVDDRAEQSGELALFDIDAKYGDVISLDDALSLLRQRSATRMELQPEGARVWK